MDVARTVHEDLHRRHVGRPDVPRRGVAPLSFIKTGDALHAQPARRLEVDEQQPDFLQRISLVWNHCGVIPREGGGSSTPHRLRLRDPRFRGDDSGEIGERSVVPFDREPL
jgi:hypothetical protein